MISKAAKDFSQMCLDTVPDFKSIDCYIREHSLSPETLTEAAYEIIDTVMYVDFDSSKHLAPLMELFLSYGMNPDSIYDGEVLMSLFRFIHKDYAGADALSVFLEYGGNPDIQPENDGVTLLSDIMGDISIGAFEDDKRKDGALHCMLVAAGCGGKLTNGDTVKMLDGYDMSILKNHRLFDCKVVRSDDVHIHAILKENGKTVAVI